MYYNVMLGMGLSIRHFNEFYLPQIEATGLGVLPNIAQVEYRLNKCTYSIFVTIESNVDVMPLLKTAARFAQSEIHHVATGKRGRYEELCSIRLLDINFGSSIDPEIPTATLIASVVGEFETAELARAGFMNTLICDTSCGWMTRLLARIEESTEKAREVVQQLDKAGQKP